MSLLSSPGAAPESPNTAAMVDPCVTSLDRHATTFGWAGIGMDALATNVTPALGARSGPALFAEAYSSWPAAEARWARLCASGEALAFQRVPWVRAWYRHCAGAGVEPLVVFVADRTSGADLMALALIRQREGWRRVITFADRGLTDYNAPVLGRLCPATLSGRDLRRALLAALPPADMLRLEKMPVTIGGRANPLAALPGTRPSRLAGHVLELPATWEEWLAAQNRHARKEIGRWGRLFGKYPDGAFRRYGPGPEAEGAYQALRRMQRVRIAGLGLPYILDEPPAAAFYDTVVRDGLRDGTAVLTALTIGDEVVAALLGITDGRHYAVTRLAMPGPQWAHFSPGRLLIARTIEAMSRDGYRSFDLTIGAYDYKRQLGAVPIPLVELHRALTPLGWGELAAVRLRDWLRTRPALHPWANRLRRFGVVANA